MSGDTWAITPSTSATLLRAAATIAGAGSLTLLTNDVAPYGCGYKLLITAAGNASAVTFTVVGVKVGDLTGALTTEVITGPNTTTASSTNFYTYVMSITASGAVASNISIGTTGSLALPRTRVKSVYYVGAASAGSIKLNLNSSSGALLLHVGTPASATFSDSVDTGGEGILTTRSAVTDFAVVTLSQVTDVTLFCG